MAAPVRAIRTSNSVDRALEILVLVARTGRPQRFVDIQRRSGVPKGSLHSILASLEQAGFLERDPAGAYSIGLRAFEVGAAFSAHTTIRDTVGPVLEKLRDRFNETIHFGILRGGEVVYVERRDSTHEVRYAAGLGERKPAYGTALGKAMLARLRPGEVERLYPAQLSALTDRTLATRAALIEQLAAIAAQGYATEDEESIPGVRCVGAALTVGDTVYGLSTTVPVQRATMDQLIALTPALTEAAEDIRARLHAVDWVRAPIETGA